MRLFRIEAALAGAVLVACGLGCETRVLGDRPPTGRDAGMGGSAGDPGNTGGGGTEDPGGGGSVGSGGGSGDPCVISCGTVACPVRASEPRVLVTAPGGQQIAAIAVSADTVYWGTYPSAGGGEVRSMPLAGGPSALLAQNVTVAEIYLDGSTLYYATSEPTGVSSLFAVPATGGTSRMIATGSEIRYVTSDASHIYFGQKVSGGYRIARAERAASGVTPVVEAMGALWGFAVDESNIYWASYSNGGSLARRSLAGGNITTLRASSAPITSPVADGDDIIFVEGISTPDTCQSSVWSVSKAGGDAPRLISPGTSGIDIWRPVRDATHLYWGRSGRQGAILRTVKGQTPEILAEDQRSIGPLILGPADVYWIASSGSGYEVRTLPK
jgi:uncharacterized protein DUF5050